jgi:ABC-type phosphate transport system substrate-binding protein
MKRYAWIAIGALAALMATAVYSADLAIIVNPSNPVRAMTLGELGKIVKGKSTTWPTGHGITLVLRDPGTPAMRLFVEKVMGMGGDEAKAMLNDTARKAAGPVVFADSDADIVKLVESNSSAIGVVDVYNITGGVKVIKIDDKQPFDPGYVLKAH